MTKTFPKRRPNPKKTDAQNMLFVNIHFFTFWLPFRKLWGLQVGAETLTKRKAAVRKTLLGVICEHLLLLTSIFRRFGLPKWTQNWTFFACFRERPIFQNLRSRRGESSIFKVLSFPKMTPNCEKIDVKNVLFFYIDFFGFCPRFSSLLGLQLGAKLAILASKN